MNLAALRRAAVKQRLRIRFSLSNGMECVVNEHGVAQVPALRAVPAFNLEEELAGAREFVVEPANPGAKDRPAAPRRCDPAEMAALTAGGGDAAHDEHDE